jgi:excisionase family DNA binding protein
MDAQQTATARGDPAEDLTLESIDETARALGCSRRTVYQLIAHKELRSVHVGRRHLIPRCERIRYVRARLEREGEAA